MISEEKILKPGEEKIREYIGRIKAGEDKAGILEGLPPSFVEGIEKGLEEPEAPEAEVPQEKIIPPQYEGLDADTLDFIWTIPIYADSKKTEAEKARKERALQFLRQDEKYEKVTEDAKQEDEKKIEDLKQSLGIPEAVNQGEAIASKEAGREQLAALINQVCNGRQKAIADLYKDFFENINDRDSRKRLASALFQDVYNRYRRADYPIEPDEEKIWEDYLKSTNIGVNNKKSEWMYRGVFPESGVETLTRGSLNVRVTPELIDALDQMIVSGKIKANYKFGQPGTAASPVERHDSISIYFLEEPSEEALKEIASIAKPYVRGDNLLGRKVSDGFYLSEVGSVETRHIDAFVEDMKTKDAALAEAIRAYTSPQVGRGTSLKMSEAQFYAIKDVVKAFGYDISYDKEKGFVVSKTE